MGKLLMLLSYTLNRIKPKAGCSNTRTASSIQTQARCMIKLSVFVTLVP